MSVTHKRSSLLRRKNNYDRKNFIAPEREGIFSFGCEQNFVDKEPTMTRLWKWRQDIQENDTQPNDMIPNGGFDNIPKILT